MLAEFTLLSFLSDLDNQNDAEFAYPRESKLLLAITIPKPPQNAHFAVAWVLINI